MTAATDDRAVAPGTQARAAAAALAGLPGMGPRRLTTLVEEMGPVGAWSAIVEGSIDEVVAVLAKAGQPGAAAGALRDQARTWRVAGRAVDPGRFLHDHLTAGVEVILRGEPAYPSVLDTDLEPPAVLFVRGDLAALSAERVAIVGTRRCTGAGAGVARELGRELTAAGIAVVSGLALGIDGAAHRGALDALSSQPTASRPIGVVGSGLDVVYPARHRSLWGRVAEEGVLLSEAPLGCRPAAWRFPARNRVIAALASVVVVVESHAAGGSLHTVNEAMRRDVDVMAVPGSVRNPAAAGVNQLIAEGCAPARDAGDVLVALGLTPRRRAAPIERRPEPGPVGAAVLEAFEWEPATLENLLVRTSVPLSELAMAIEELVDTGWVRGEGGWYERISGS